MSKLCGCEGEDLCLRHKIQTIRLSASATPTRRQEALRGLAADNRLDADRSAYKRLRDDGLQPPRLDGAAELERKATIAEHVESGHTEWEPATIRQAEDLLGRKVTEPNDTGSRWIKT